MKRGATLIISGGLLAAAAAITLAGAVSAAEYNLKAPNMSLIGGSDLVTGVTVQITDLTPASTATISWTSVPPATSSGAQSAVADAEGNVRTTFIPSAAGNYEVDATGTDLAGEPWAGSLPVTVQTTRTTRGAAAGTQTAVPVAETEQVVGGLADTGGGNVGLLLALGAGALVAGGTSVAVARNRARGTADSA